MKKQPIALLMTGNELMRGDVIDSNSAMIAQHFNDIGLDISKKVTVADDLPLLVSEIIELSKNSALLFINGGLGPTTDDLTSQALASALGVDLKMHDQALAHLQHWAQQKNIPLNDPNLKQALLPVGCDIIANELGSAVGFRVSYNHCEIICTPGVPKELQHMLSRELIPYLKEKHPTNSATKVIRMQVFGLGESTLQAMIVNAFPDWPSDIEIGYRASMPLLELKLTTRSAQASLKKADWLEKIQRLLGDHLLGEIAEQPKNLSSYVVNLLGQQQQKLTTAESCTGGLIASQITQIPGSSEVFEAGYVTYSNQMKTKMLQVSEQTMLEHGAVSKATVIAMAQGALINANADYAIAVSGVAGPDGGSPEKPVGTVWIAWGKRENINAQLFTIRGNRHYFQEMVAARSLDLIRRMLIGSKEKPRYSKP